jgi:hypothetical protein
LKNKEIETQQSLKNKDLEMQKYKIKMQALILVICILVFALGAFNQALWQQLLAVFGSITSIFNILK